uniref:Uncharacterized protein n=1 Tax=Lepeophtheirus salmonis TaxID=72036 RepID=A0A0K2TGF8_LEPSM
MRCQHRNNEKIHSSICVPQCYLYTYICTRIIDVVTHLS